MQKNYKGFDSNENLALEYLRQVFCEEIEKEEANFLDYHVDIIFEKCFVLSLMHLKKVTRLAEGYFMDERKFYEFFKNQLISISTQKDSKGYQRIIDFKRANIVLTILTRLLIGNYKLLSNMFGVSYQLELKIVDDENHSDPNSECEEQEGVENNNTEGEEIESYSKRDNDSSTNYHHLQSNSFYDVAGQKNQGIFAKSLNDNLKATNKSLLIKK